MRIDRLEIENFKGVVRQEFSLHPQLTLFVGDNGSGKTTVLDALAVAAAVWLVEPPDSMLRNSGRNIARNEIRLEGRKAGDRMQFREVKPVVVKASGRIAGRESMTWTRQVRAGGTRTSNAEARDALQHIRNQFEWDENGEYIRFPVLAYYGAGRAWVPSNQPLAKIQKTGEQRRWRSYYDCFQERIRFAELRAWFARETMARGNRGGAWRPGFDVVRQAVLGCVPGAGDIWYDVDQGQIVIAIGGNPQPFGNLSAGQRMMVSLVADLAIKAVSLNPFLLETDGESLLRQTPGLVLIDELDVHLHPIWQRRVASDLKRTFPEIQFVCTTHSPQVIGEVLPAEVRTLENLTPAIPPESFGMDSNRVLEEIQGTPARNESRQREIDQIFEEIDREHFDKARRLMAELERVGSPDDPELLRARSLMRFLEPA
jgi:predicted ATP-binding protein involved in virulence